MRNQEIQVNTSETCPSCFGTRMEHFIRSNDRDIVKCGDCGLMFVAQRPTTDEIAAFFREEYISSEEMLDVAMINWRKASLQREAAHLERLLPQGGKLLDIGVASGYFAGLFVGKDGWHVEGVEPSNRAAASAAERYGFKVHNGILRDVDLEDASFDAVTTLDTFFFISDPRKDLEKIARILRPGGYFLIEIPGLNFRLMKNTGWMSKLIYGESARLNAGVHLFYYSHKTLSDLVAQFGFSKVASYPEQAPVRGSWFLRTINHLYFWLTGALYRLTGGRINWASKEFIIFRKAGG